MKPLKKPWKTYQQSTSKKRGSKSDWQDLAARLSGHLSLGHDIDAALKLLGLRKVPETIAGLLKARRLIMRKVHPDMGGSERKAAELNEAFTVIKYELTKGNL
jgi:hypothetical protein